MWHLKWYIPNVWLLEQNSSFMVNAVCWFGDNQVSEQEWLNVDIIVILIWTANSKKREKYHPAIDLNAEKEKETFSIESTLYPPISLINIFISLYIKM